VISAGALSVTTVSLGLGTVGQDYSEVLTATGGAPPYSWSIDSGSLPGGLTLFATGSISGTPTAAGSFSFTVRVTDSAARTATSRLLSITISPAPLSITTTSPLVAGTVGTPYSQSLAATGGTTPYVWTLTSGTWPAGLTLSGAGVISGTPTAVDTASLTVQVTDSGSRTATKVFSITINPPPLLITTASPLPAGTVGAAYSQTLGATGGTPTYTWSIALGTLPAGLTLSAAGVISGTPTAAIAATFTVQVTDSASRTSAKALSIAINAVPLSITTTSPLAAGTVGVSYSQTLTATGGTAPFTWSMASGSLPPAGLTLSAAGVISGTPATTTTANFTVQVTDSASQTATKALSITVNVPTLSITTDSLLTAGTVGVSYSQNLTAAGGRAPYTWSLVSGTLPAGLTLAAAGVIRGTPTAATTANFTVQVTDSASQTATKLFLITVTPELLSIVTTSPLATGTVGATYSQTLTATGAAAPYTWSLISGPLPAGLTLSSAGVISGTPTAPVTSNFTVQVADSGSQTASKLLSITINAAPVSLSITTASPLPAGTVGGVYSVTLGASGGVPHYSWSITAGTLPVGLTLSSGGTLSGTPTTAGTLNFTIQVSEANAAVISKPFSLTVQAGLTITTTSPLPTAVVASSYSQQLQASIADPLTWSVVSGNLPTGITLFSSGLVGGTPTSAGTFDFTVQATGGTPQQIATQLFRLEVSAGFVITTPPTLPDGTASVSYTATLNASGGTAPYSWILSGGNLPDGLNLSSSGLISGTPTDMGVFTITVQASDNSGLKASKVFRLSIAAAPLGSLSLNVPAMMNPAQQVPIGLSLSAVQPNPVSGSLKIAFASNSVIPADDPAVLFSTGSRTVPFTIPPNTTTAVFPAPVLLLTGTVSGTVSVTADIDSGPAGLPVATVTIPPTAPKLTNLAAERTLNGLRVQITGYSPERKLSNAEFAFDVRTPAGIQHVNLVRNVEPEFDAWYKSAASTAFGSSFVFEQLFSVQGDAGMIDAVTISLTNGQGSASSTPVPIPKD
ncbi:MAG: hypothetical protein DMG14_28555, partial [Acidobacteria bacterium]